MIFTVAPLRAQRAPGDLDVPFIPTSQATVEAMLRVAGVGPEDFVIELKQKYQEVEGPRTARASRC